MNHETQKNIKKYRAALPGLRERIVATALLLAISLSMVVSASFAWYTISAAPEVSAVSTTVAANGNLEIALVDRDGKEPEDSAVGDSSATQGQSLVSANVTWGNLVNLADASYGISHMSLRPARLTGYNMNITPLYGATYSADGRVEKVSETYMYASWQDNENVEDEFVAGSRAEYGVRAIASVKASYGPEQQLQLDILGNVDNAYNSATALYKAVVDNEVDVGGVKSIDALTALLTVYVNEQAVQTLRDRNYQENYGGVVHYMYNLVDKFCEINDAEGVALMNLANLMGLKAGKLRQETFFTSIDQVVEAYNAGKLKTDYGVELASMENTLGRYAQNRRDIYEARRVLTPYAADEYKPSSNPPQVFWSEISSSVGYLVNIDTATIAEKGGTPHNINNLASLGKKALASMVMGAFNQSGALEVVIMDGTLADTEQRLGRMLNDKLMGIALNIEDTGLSWPLNSLKGTVYATVDTDATNKNPPYNDYYANYDKGQAAKGGFTGQTDNVSAKDVYGMAVDLWVRTNSKNVNLILEGNVDTEEVQDTCVARNGEEVPLYTIVEETGKVVEVYSLMEEVPTEEGQEPPENPVYVQNWYNAATHTFVGTNDELSEQEITPAVKTVDVVIGYSGVNRIWEDFQSQLMEGQIAEDYTTQGAGSCYVFYADPSDQGNILKLLDAFTIAFLDQSGKKLAEAKLDTLHAYAINGKVTVPLKLTDGITYTVKKTDESGNVVKDEEGNDVEVEKIAIMAMDQNAPTWITAVIYLDGEGLDNDQVLAAGNIEGRLNLQFGSSEELNSAENEELRREKIQMTAEAYHAGTNQKSSKVEQPIQLEYDGTAQKITVTVTVTEGSPKTISGFFIRSVSASQGSRMEAVDFSPAGGNTWTADFYLSKPGTYLLRDIIVDGVPYNLEKTLIHPDGTKETQTNYPAVEIEGLAVSNVWCSETGVIMTAEGFKDVDVRMNIGATAELMPRQVRAVFRDTVTDEIYNANMTHDGNGLWTGTARFTNSGTFKLERVIMDGAEQDLPENQQKLLIITLGLYAEVGCTNLEDVPAEFTNEVTLNMRLKIKDSANIEQRGLDGVKLYYHSVGSNNDANGMNCNVTYNPTTGYYEGNLLLKSPGVFVFNRVDIPKEEEGAQPNSVYRAASAPRFSVISKDPPEFVRNVTDDYQFVPNNLGRLKDSSDGASAVSGAVMGVHMKNTQAALIWAVMRNTMGTETTEDDFLAMVSMKEDEGYILDQGEGKGSVYYFDVPRNTSGDYKDKQDGQWVMDALCLQNVYIPGENGGTGTMIDAEPVPDLSNYRTEGVCHVIALQNNTTKVVETVNISTKMTFTEGDTATTPYEVKNGAAITAYALGKDNTGKVDGTFMDSYNANIEVTITDWQGMAILTEQARAANAPTLLFEHSDQKNKGGYTGGKYDNKNVPLTASGTAYTTTQSFQLAGTYKTTLMFTVDGVEFKTENVPNIEVWSIKPTVTVSAISPAATEDIPTTIKYKKNNTLGTVSYTLGGKENDNVLSENGDYAKIFAKAKTVTMGADMGAYGQDATFDIPNVTFTAASVDDDSKVVFVLPSKNADVPEVTVTINGNSNSSAIVLGNLEEEIFKSQGRITKTWYTVDAYRGRGEVTIKEIQIERNGVTYYVTLDHSITIDNPSSRPTT